MGTVWRVLLTFVATAIGFFGGAIAGLVLGFLLAWLLTFFPGLQNGFVVSTVFWLIASLFSVASAVTCGVHVYRSTGPKTNRPRGFEVLQKK